MKAVPSHAKNNQELAGFFLTFSTVTRSDTVKLNLFLAINGYHHLGNDIFTARPNSKQQQVVQVNSRLQVLSIFS